jgi:hypothetical protein
VIGRGRDGELIWAASPQRLASQSVAQDGDDEGCLHLDHLPTSAEAVLIRVALGVRRRIPTRSRNESANPGSNGRTLID